MPVVQCRVDVMTVSSGTKACLGAIALALTGTLFAQESEHEPGETEHTRYAISGFIGGTHVGGSDDLHALERAGKLDPLGQAVRPAGRQGRSGHDDGWHRLSGGRDALQHDPALSMARICGHPGSPRPSNAML